MPGRQLCQGLVFRVFGFAIFFLRFAGVGQPAKPGCVGYLTGFDKCSLERFVLELLGLVGQQQCQRALVLRQRARCAVHHQAQIVQSGQPHMALCGEAGFGGAKLSLLKRAVAQHFEQVCARQCGLLIPEQATLAVAVAAHARFKISAGVRIAKSALVFEQQRKLLVQQHP